MTTVNSAFLLELLVILVLLILKSKKIHFTIIDKLLLLFKYLVEGAGHWTLELVIRHSNRSLVATTLELIAAPSNYVVLQFH